MKSRTSICRRNIRVALQDRAANSQKLEHCDAEGQGGIFEEADELSYHGWDHGAQRLGQHDQQGDLVASQPNGFSSFFLPMGTAASPPRTFSAI
jgi:hypothetical protein